MALTKAQASKIEAKALAMPTKSEGMRLLFDNGYTVVEVKDIFVAPYGFVYGVAARHNGANMTAAARRAPKAQTARKAKAPVARVSKASPAVKVTKVAGNRKARSVSEPASATAKVAARLAGQRAAKAAPKRPGRPTAARRATNRKPRTGAASKA